REVAERSAARGVAYPSDCPRGPGVSECSEISESECLNSRIPLPSERPSSGSRLAPNTSSSTTRSSAMWVGLANPTMLPSFRARSRPISRQRSLALKDAPAARDLPAGHLSPTIAPRSAGLCSLAGQHLVRRGAVDGCGVRNQMVVAHPASVGGPLGLIEPAPRLARV